MDHGSQGTLTGPFTCVIVRDRLSFFYSCLSACVCVCVCVSVSVCVGGSCVWLCEYSFVSMVVSVREILCAVYVRAPARSPKIKTNCHQQKLSVLSPALQRRLLRRRPRLKWPRLPLGRQRRTLAQCTCVQCILLLTDLSQWISSYLPLCSRLKVCWFDFTLYPMC